MTQTKLVPVEQKQVEFYEDEVLAVRLENGAVMVPLRPIVERLGLDWRAQTRRINRDPILSEEIQSVAVTATDSYRTIKRDMLCLPLDFVSGFLFGVNANRVKAELRERVIMYQRECHKVLAEAFSSGRLTNNDLYQKMMVADTPSAVAYRHAQAIMQLAEQQFVHEEQLADHNRRLESLEAELGRSDRSVTRTQAADISQAVKAVALQLGQRSGKNEYGGVYGELYRRFEIASYKDMPASRFDEAMDFLNEWLQTLTQSNPF